MASFVNTFFEKRVEDLFDLARLIERAFSAAGLEYPVVGDLAAYLYVEESEPDAGRLTKDIDIIVRRQDIDAIANAVEPFGPPRRSCPNETHELPRQGRSSFERYGRGGAHYPGYRSRTA